MQDCLPKPSDWARLAEAIARYSRKDTEAQASATSSHQ
jgi:hypothetical protein